jgi:hypothetical protein
MLKRTSGVHPGFFGRRSGPRRQPTRSRRAAGQPARATGDPPAALELAAGPAVLRIQSPELAGSHRLRQNHRRACAGPPTVCPALGFGAHRRQLAGRHWQLEFDQLVDGKYADFQTVQFRCPAWRRRSLFVVCAPCSNSAGSKTRFATVGYLNTSRRFHEIAPAGGHEKRWPVPHSGKPQPELRTMASGTVAGLETRCRRGRPPHKNCRGARRN